jgi:pimeloyl-ACP methyl ester carboxylesterase
MKKLKETAERLINISPDVSTDTLLDLLWQYLLYSPKMPLRLLQEQLLNKSERYSLAIFDKYFTGRELTFQAFKWGKGPRKILLTHGWGSKAADFYDLVSALTTLPDTEIIAFDVPGNGSSEGELANLFLFIQAVKNVISQFGAPDILIGHSLGAMANIIALRETNLTPSLVISITPLIRLKENFEASMDAVHIDKKIQALWFDRFQQVFGVPASQVNLNFFYDFDARLKHLLFYDPSDKVAPDKYLQEFLVQHPFIDTRQYAGVGHEKVLRSSEVIGEITKEITAVLDL